MENKQSLIERLFEGTLWSSRFIILLGVFFGVISAIVLFIAGSYEIYHSIINSIFSGHGIEFKMLLSGVIGGVDFYLIGIVLLMFSFGIYELFISKIDVARTNTEVTILEISSLDELKDRIIKVIIMVLVVSFFQRVLSMHYETPMEMLYLAVSIFVLSVGIYFMHKKKK